MVEFVALRKQRLVCAAELIWRSFISDYRQPTKREIHPLCTHTRHKHVDFYAACCHYFAALGHNHSISTN